MNCGVNAEMSRVVAKSNTASSSVSKLIEKVVLLAKLARRHVRSLWMRRQVIGFRWFARSSHKSLDFCVTLRCKTFNHGESVQAVEAFWYAVDLSDMLCIVRWALGGVPDDCLGADDPRLFEDGNNC